MNLMISGSTIMNKNILQNKKITKNITVLKVP
jgi:hypothetical protein